MAAFKFQDQAFLANTHRHAVTPESFPNLYRWYKADSFPGGTADGAGVAVTGVSPWVDQTGSGDNASHPFGVAYRTIAGFGGRPWLAFGGAGSGFLNFAPGALGDFTIIVVSRIYAASDAFEFHNPINNHQIRRSLGGDNVTLFYEGTGAGQAASALGSPLAVLCMTIRRSGATVSFRENKTSRGSFVYSAGAWTVNQIGSSVLGVDHDFGEIMIYTDAKSDADVDLLYDDYTKPRWTVLP